MTNEYAPNPPQTLLQKFDAVCTELFDRWDRDMRSGKLLLALLGRVPGYKPETTEIRNAIAAHDDLVKALENAPRPKPSADPVEYMDWYFKVRTATLSRIKTEG